jgi:hypothetical protein
MKIVVKTIPVMIPNWKYLAMKLKKRPKVHPNENSFTVSVRNDMMRPIYSKTGKIELNKISLHDCFLK